MKNLMITFVGAIAFLAALAVPGHADIVYHSANIVINNGSYNLDLNGDGVTDFTIASATASCGPNCYTRNLFETPASGNAVIVGPLKRGDEIGANETFGGAALMSEYKRAWVCNRYYCGWVNSDWGPWWGRSGYLGLSFQVNGQIYYGWALLKCTGGVYGGGQGTLLGYAYESIPSRAILAGETSYAWFSSTSLNFGTVTVGTTVSKSVTLTNLGPTTLTITNALLTGTHAADFGSLNGNPPCAGSVVAGATCTLTFTFKPSITGKERASYAVYDNTSGSPQYLSLTGTGQ